MLFLLFVQCSQICLGDELIDDKQDASHQSAEQKLVWLRDAWQTQNQCIKSAEISFLSITQSSELKQFSAEKVRECFAFVSRDAVKENPEELLSKFIDTDSPKWGWGRLIVSGNKVRSESESLLFVRNDLFEVWVDRPNRQMELSQHGKSIVKPTTLKDFQNGSSSILDYLLSANNVNIYEWMVSYDETLMLVVTDKAKSYRHEFVVRSQDGLLLRRTIYRNGSITHDAHYKDYYRDENGISFPQCIMNTQFSEGLATFLMLKVVDQCAINKEIDDSLFIVPVPQGFRITDNRDPIKKKVSIQKEILDDVTDINADAK